MPISQLSESLEPIMSQNRAYVDFGKHFLEKYPELIMPDTVHAPSGVVQSGDLSNNNNADGLSITRSMKEVLSEAPESMYAWSVSFFPFWKFWNGT